MIVTTAQATAGEDTASLYDIMLVLLRARRFVLLSAVVPAVVATLVTLLSPRQWSSESAFIPQSRRNATDISGFAAQFGVALPGQDATQSPAFYSQLITGRELLGTLVDSSFVIAGDTLWLSDVFRIRERDSQVRRELTVKALKKQVVAVTVPKSGMVRLTATAPSPDLALQINRRMLSLVNQFNLEKRQSQAASERRFVERRLADARTETRASEDRLQEFLRRNRDFRNSPELTFQQERLSREAALRQQVYSQLAQSYEQSRIEEVRDTPLITIVESPELPGLPNSRGTLAKLLLAGLAGFGLGAFVALARNNGGKRGSLAEEWQAVRLELLRPWRLFSRRPSDRVS